jgi:hypothetical protein
MEAMGIKDYDVWLRQPAFYRDDMVLIAEARHDAEKLSAAERKAKEKIRGTRR